MSDDSITDADKSYDDALLDYFKLKTRYENQKTNKSGNRKCIKCNRPVNTLFTNEKSRYKAVCGASTNPCKLHLELFRGHFIHNDTALTGYKKIYEASKDAIIQQKLDTIFKYTDESTSAKKFKTEFEQYNIASTLYKEMLSTIQQIHDDPIKAETLTKLYAESYELVRKLRGLSEDYRNTNNDMYITDIVNIEITELFPILNKIRLLSYDINKVNVHETTETTEYMLNQTLQKQKRKILMSDLIQQPVLDSKNETNIQEPPSVIEWVI